MERAPDKGRALFKSGVNDHTGEGAGRKEGPGLEGHSEEFGFCSG